MCVHQHSDGKNSLLRLLPQLGHVGITLIDMFDEDGHGHRVYCIYLASPWDVKNEDAH